MAASVTLGGALLGDRSWSRRLLLIGAGAGLIAASAQVSVPLGFTPVPLTGQTFAVLLSGAVMGWRRGFLSQMAYLAEGAAGLPVFADGAGSAVHLVGPSAGYLWCFPLAAALVGFLVEKGVARSFWRLAGALVSADVLILVAGSTWLRLLFRIPFAQAWVLGFYPFLIADVVKVVLVGGSLPRVLKRFEARPRSPVHPRAPQESELVDGGFPKIVDR